MTNRLYVSSLTVPASTAIATPFTQSVALDDLQLDSVRIVIPPGHAALTGFRLTWGGTQIVPYSQGTFITGDSEIIDFPLDGEVTVSGLVMSGYNLDIFPHTFYLRWLLSELPKGSPIQTVSNQLGGANTASNTADIASLAAAAVPPPDQTVTSDQSGNPNGTSSGG